MESGSQAAIAHKAQAANQKLLRVLRRHMAPAIGFVNEKTVERLAAPTGTAIFEAWVSQGLDLGNHSYTHRDANHLTRKSLRRRLCRGRRQLHL